MTPILFGIAAWLLLAVLSAAMRLLAVRRRKRDVRRRIELEMHRSTHHVGAWMIAVPSSQTGGIAGEMAQMTRRRDPPARIVDVLREAGGRVVGHLPGPHAEREQSARAWLADAAPRIAGVRVPFSDGATPVVVLAYAGREPPPSSCRLDDVRDHLDRCIGAALVVCRPQRMAFIRDRAYLVNYALVGGAAVLVFALVARSLGQVPAKGPVTARPISAPAGGEAEARGQPAPAPSMQGNAPPAPAKEAEKPSASGSAAVEPPRRPTPRASRKTVDDEKNPYDALPTRDPLPKASAAPSSGASAGAAGTTSPRAKTQITAGEKKR